MEQIPQAVVWLVSLVLVEAAVIDGRSLRVPNWLTYHFAIGGLIFAFWKGGSPLLAWSFAGAGVGLLSLLPLYAVGGMGAGDVKLMAGMGAWVGPWLTFWAFISTAMVGGLMGLAMMAYSGNMFGHIVMMRSIFDEIITIRNPTELAQRAAERKPRMLLLPYGIPIAVGSITYFAWSGFLF
jgi:prepilin peptidase CpaA